MTVEELTAFLETECAGLSTAEAYIDAFERMAALPVDAAHDELMFQYGTYNWFRGNGNEFEVSLSRTLPDNGDEYLNVNLNIFYEPDDWNAAFKGAESSLSLKCTHAEFMRRVRASALYQQLSGRKIKRVRVYRDGT